MRIRMGRGGDELQPVSRRHPKLRSGGRRRERGGRVGGTGLRSATALGTIPFGSMDKFPLWISSCMPMNLSIKANRGPHASWCAGLYKGNIGGTEVMKDSLNLACVIPDAGDTAFQFHCLERSAYATVLRAFYAQSNLLSWLQAKLLTKLRNELRISNIEHKEVLVRVSSNDYIKSSRKFSLANDSGLTEMNPAFDARVVVPGKIVQAGQVSASSSSDCLSLAQQSPIPAHSMSSARCKKMFECEVAKTLSEV